MDSVLHQAQQISQSSNDSRTLTYATQLKTRFQTLSANVQVVICSSYSCDKVQDYMYAEIERLHLNYENSKYGTQL